tara:strand:+ start:541 stop:774 length:234 start_codon:yes stop_codon:yes gene_type:complete
MRTEYEAWLSKKPKPSYLTDSNIRTQIDSLLKVNASLQASLGCDSTIKEKATVKGKTDDLMALIKGIDLDFYNLIEP